MLTNQELIDLEHTMNDTEYFYKLPVERQSRPLIMEVLKFNGYFIFDVIEPQDDMYWFAASHQPYLLIDYYEHVPHVVTSELEDMIVSIHPDLYTGVKNITSDMTMRYVLDHPSNILNVPVPFVTIDVLKAYASKWPMHRPFSELDSLEVINAALASLHLVPSFSRLMSSSQHYHHIVNSMFDRFGASAVAYIRNEYHTDDMLISFMLKFGDTPLYREFVKTKEKLYIQRKKGVIYDNRTRKV